MLRGVNRLFCTVFHQLTVMAPPQLPRSGPAILVCNHTSGLDPLLLQGTINRVIVWMMAKEYYEMAALRWFFETIEAIPVSRNGRDSAATRAALRALEHGNILGIFPEGRISPDRNFLPFQTGVAMMAIKTKMPVYPAYLDGSQRGLEMIDGFKQSCRANLRFGPVINLPDGDTSRPALEMGTETIQNVMADLRRQTPAPFLARG
jgi:1-acyl-sn-glycerol-3-phosphate acyltransferase